MAKLPKTRMGVGEVAPANSGILFKKDNLGAVSLIYKGLSNGGGDLGEVAGQFNYNNIYNYLLIRIDAAGSLKKYSLVNCIVLDRRG